MIDKDQNNNLSAVVRKLEHFEAVYSKDFIINIDSMAIISYEREEKFRTKNRVLQRDRVLERTTMNSLKLVNCHEFGVYMHSLCLTRTKCDRQGPK